jgi:hypothetical protein
LQPPVPRHALSCPHRTGFPTASHSLSGFDRRPRLGDPKQAVVGITISKHRDHRARTFPFAGNHSSHEQYRSRAWSQFTHTELCSCGWSLRGCPQHFREHRAESSATGRLPGLLGFAFGNLFLRPSCESAFLGTVFLPSDLPLKRTSTVLADTSDRDLLFNLHHASVYTCVMAVLSTVIFSSPHKKGTQPESTLPVAVSGTACTPRLSASIRDIHRAPEAGIRPYPDPQPRCV